METIAEIPNLDLDGNSDDEELTRNENVGANASTVAGTIATETKENKIGNADCGHYSKQENKITQEYVSDKNQVRNRHSVFNWKKESVVRNEIVEGSRQKRHPAEKTENSERSENETSSSSVSHETR